MANYDLASRAELPVWLVDRRANLIGPAVERRVRLLQTIHRNVSAIDPVGARRGEEHDHIRDLLGGTERAHRKSVPDVVVEKLGISQR